MANLKNIRKDFFVNLGFRTKRQGVAFIRANNLNKRSLTQNELRQGIVARSRRRTDFSNELRETVNLRNTNQETKRDISASKIQNIIRKNQKRKRNNRKEE
jgi:hypothetical protein